jgi:hypothetical protein
MTSSRTARIAGKRPPKTPIARVIRTATVITNGPNRNETVISENERAEYHRLTEERHEDVEPREPERSHGADLAGAGAHRGVHRVRGGEHRAEGQQHGDQRPRGLEEEARLRLARIVVALALG